MKHLLLIACLFFGSLYTAHAGNGPTQHSNDSAIAAERTVLSSKIAQLQTAYSANPASATSNQLTAETKDLLTSGMKLTFNATFLEKDATKNAAIVKRYYVLEKANHEFRKLSGSPAQNHAELLKQAQAFYSSF